MSDLTPELNLALAVDDDDTADYLVTSEGLHGSLLTLDGMFNTSTGHSHFGAHNGAPVNPSGFPDNSIPGAKLQDGTVTYAKLVANILEALFTGCHVNPTTNYVVQTTSPVMFVQCNAAITVTLTSGMNRPVTVRANSGNSTVNATTGTVYGGSIDTTTGAVINGRVNQGDAVTYKFDGSNWVAL